MSSRSSSKFSNRKLDQHRCVGWVQAAHGLRGELFVRLFAGQADWLQDARELALWRKDVERAEVFPIERAKPHKDGLILKLKGIDNRNQSELYPKAEVHLREDVLIAKPGEALYLTQIEGFAVVDPHGEHLGQIVGFDSNGAQDLLRVQTAEGVEALVPLIDAFLLGIDFDKRQVRMDLPPGLINVEEDK